MLAAEGVRAGGGEDVLTARAVAPRALRMRTVILSTLSAVGADQQPGVVSCHSSVSQLFMGSN